MTAVILPPSVPSIRRGFRLQFEPAPKMISGETNFRS